jgi:pyruvate,orthophosphate dikinase
MRWGIGLQPEGILMIEPGSVPPPDDLRARAGGKAYNLLKLAALGFPVPQGFVLPTTMCRGWIETAKPSLADFKAAFAGTIERLERASGLRFGDFRRPLLVSVRSGAQVSMPGMLDTVLNVGFTLGAIPGFVALTGNPRLAWDCYRRLIESYAQSVHGAGLEAFDEATGRAFAAAGARSLAELDTIALRELTLRSLHVFQEITNSSFPDDPHVQLLNAIDAVFRSWNSERAKTYRQINGLDDLAGTAVTIQRMVFGNAGAGSGAGVGFTRDPVTGEKRLYIDFAFDAQGEDVVSGRKRVSTDSELRKILPEVAASLEEIAARLERVFGYAQDFEFTVADGQLYLLQTRDAKSTNWARLKITLDLVDEGLLSPEDARQRLRGLNPETLARKRVRPGQIAIASGTSAGLGVATGAIAFSLETAGAAVAKGQAAILVRNDIATEDVRGIAAAEGILTSRGGRTSHAAVVAREFGKVAIVGCRDLQISADEESCMLGGSRLNAGEQITLDGETGTIYRGAPK